VYELVQDTKFGREDEEDIPPELSFNYMEIPAREVVATGATRQQLLNAQRQKLGKYYDKYYNCQFITEGGKVLASHLL
jgi:hypothetical protein